MRTAKWTDQTSADELLREGQHEEVVVVRDGQPVALVVPFDADDLEWYARERDPRFLDSIAAARRDVADGRAISHDELKRELGLEQ